MNFQGPLEDRIAIRELLDEYSDAVTQRNGVAWAATWLDSEECVWLLPSMAEWAQFVGKKLIVDEWYKMMDQYHGPESNPDPISFFTIPGSIKVEGDIAHVRSYTTEVFQDAKGDTLETKGQYDDVCVKKDGRWYFRDRTWNLFPLGDHLKIKTEKKEHMQG